jgi:hypothetical protein
MSALFSFETMESRRLLSAPVLTAAANDPVIVSAPDVLRVRPNSFLYNFSSTPHIHHANHTAHVHHVAHIHHSAHVRTINHNSK